MHASGKSTTLIRAHICANNRRFREAARLLQEAGAERDALEMFADLRMFNEAQVFELIVASSEQRRTA